MDRTPLLLFAASLFCLFCAKAEDKPIGEEVVDGKTLPNWIAELDNQDVIQRMIAINAIAKIGSKAETAVHKLLDVAVTDRSGFVSQNARRALAAIGDAAFDAIIKKLETISKRDRPELYAVMLSKFGKAYGSKLSAHLKDENGIVVRACVNAWADIVEVETVLSPFAPRSSEFHASMKLLLVHKDESVRQAAKTAIDDIENLRWKCVKIYR